MIVVFFSLHICVYIDFYASSIMMIMIRYIYKSNVFHFIHALLFFSVCMRVFFFHELTIFFEVNPLVVVVCQHFLFGVFLLELFLQVLQMTIVSKTKQNRKEYEYSHMAQRLNSLLVLA